MTDTVHADVNTEVHNFSVKGKEVGGFLLMI